MSEKILTRGTGREGQKAKLPLKEREENRLKVAESVKRRFSSGEMDFVFRLEALGYPIDLTRAVPNLGGYDVVAGIRKYVLGIIPPDLCAKFKEYSKLWKQESTSLSKKVIIDQYGKQKEVVDVEKDNIAKITKEQRLTYRKILDNITKIIYS
jgi:hypothetical protein